MEKLLELGRPRNSHQPYNQLAPYNKNKNCFKWCTNLDQMVCPFYVMPQFYRTQRNSLSFLNISGLIFTQTGVLFENLFTFITTFCKIPFKSSFKDLLVIIVLVNTRANKNKDFSNSLQLSPP